MRTINIIFIFICFTFFSCGISQDVYNDLQAKYNNLNKQNQETVNENKALDDELKLLKAKCGAGEAVMKSTCGNFVVELISAVGYKNDQRIIFDFKVTNLGPNEKSMGFSDNRGPTMLYEGKLTNEFGVTFAGKKSSYSPAPTNVSLDLQYRAHNLLIENDVVSNLELWSRGDTFRNCKFNFKNIPLEIK